MLPTKLRRSVTLNHTVNEGKFAIVRLKHESPTSGCAPPIPPLAVGCRLTN